MVSVAEQGSGSGLNINSDERGLGVKELGSKALLRDLGMRGKAVMEAGGDTGMDNEMGDTEWVHTDLDEYSRRYKGMRLFIKVKYDYSSFYIWRGRRRIDEWFDGRLRSNYKSEVEGVQKDMEAKADEWIEMIEEGYFDPDKDEGVGDFW